MNSKDADPVPIESWVCIILDSKANAPVLRGLHDKAQCASGRFDGPHRSTGKTRSMAALGRGWVLRCVRADHDQCVYLPDTALEARLSTGQNSCVPPLSNKWGIAQVIMINKRKYKAKEPSGLARSLEFPLRSLRSPTVPAQQLRHFPS
jgi:hypothetical protein